MERKEIKGYLLLPLENEIKKHLGANSYDADALEMGEFCNAMIETICLLTTEPRDEGVKQVLEQLTTYANLPCSEIPVEKCFELYGEFKRLINNLSQ